ncbi:unnamed protein product [Boreogadus saida]
MSRKKLAWANKEVETFVCILGEEDVVYDVYVAAAAIDIRPTTKGTVGSRNATSELSWANRPLPTAPLRSDPFRTLQWKCGITGPWNLDPGPGTRCLALGLGSRVYTRCSYQMARGRPRALVSETRDPPSGDVGWGPNTITPSRLL